MSDDEERAIATRQIHAMPGPFPAQIVQDELARLRADSARMDKLCRMSSSWEGGVLLTFFGHGDELRAAIDAA